MVLIPDLGDLQDELGKFVIRLVSEKEDSHQTSMRKFQLGAPRSCIKQFQYQSITFTVVIIRNNDNWYAVGVKTDMPISNMRDFAEAIQGESIKIMWTQPTELAFWLDIGFLEDRGTSPQYPLMDLPALFGLIPKEKKK